MGDDLVSKLMQRFVEEIGAAMAATGFEMARYGPQGTGRFDSGWAVGHAR
jgi:hypothetical protein